ncbi:MAG: hypothetical protein U1U88_001192 [Lawsonella clevelandensis]
MLMDVQLSPQGAGIGIDWDTRDGAFSASVLDAAYSDYIALVRALLSDDAAVAEAAWEGDGLARRMIPAIARVASSQPTTGVLGTLHGPIVEQALAHPGCGGCGRSRAGRSRAGQFGVGGFGAGRVHGAGG